MFYDITPCTKPRQTRSDKWKQRPCVIRYRAFADECRAKGVEIEQSGQKVTFFIPMPNSWSKKKRAEMLLSPHQSMPDADNLLKALLDAVHKQDCSIWSIWAEKRWAEKGAIVISGINEAAVVSNRKLAREYEE
jgi:Holliday junction resolvase RusA-like endonuclease